MEILDHDMVKDFLDDIVWSYSNLKMFKTCKRAWYRRYILGDEGTPNYYAQYGTLAHTILDKYTKGELGLLDTVPFLEYNWSSTITAESPLDRNGEPIEVEYYNQLCEFLNNFEGFQDETVGSEIEFFTDIETEHGVKKFKGFIDRLSIKDGEYIVTDYKSKGKFYSKGELKNYSIQLYFYSKYIYEKYGKFPRELKFVLFRTGKEEVIKFNEKDYFDAINYLSRSVDEVYEEFEFDYQYSYFFCGNLCEYRFDCNLD